MIAIMRSSGVPALSLVPKHPQSILKPLKSACDKPMMNNTNKNMLSFPIVFMKTPIIVSIPSIISVMGIVFAMNITTV